MSPMMMVVVRFARRQRMPKPLLQYRNSTVAAQCVRAMSSAPGTRSPPRSTRPRLRVRAVRDFPNTSPYYLPLEPGDVVTVTEVVSVPTSDYGGGRAFTVCCFECLVEQRVVARQDLERRPSERG